MNTFKQQATPAKVLFCATMCCLFSTIVQAQTIRGAVRNTDNGQPIAGATVVLRNAIAPFGGATDSTGQFVFQNMRPGYYSCEITAIGFEGQIIPEINLTAGKEQVLTIALRRSANELPELVVTASQPLSSNERRARLTAEGSGCGQSLSGRLDLFMPNM